jgi:hypothetical protein
MMRAGGGSRTWKRILILAILGLGLSLGQLPPVQALPAGPAAPYIFASPVHAGCYLAKLDRCKIHVEPFTLNIASGKKLVQFRLVTILGRTGAQTVIYNWRPDQSNPAPSVGTTYTPSLVAKDFAATCGESYEVSLQGQDTGDAGLLNLGLTAQFTCPKGTYTRLLPYIYR